MTQRLLEYIEIQSLLRTDLNVSEETGVSVRRVREVRKHFTVLLQHSIRFATPRVLGLDGVRADGHNRRVIFTDIEAGYVLDLIKSGNKKSIAARLKLFNACSGIQFVTIDMCRTLRAAVHEAIPDAIIIIDLFHIMRLANQVMDAVRVRLYPKLKREREPGQARPRPEPFRLRRDKSCPEARQERERWFAESPELWVAYDLKEGFLELFDEKTYGGKLLMSGALALQNYEQWLKRLDEEKEKGYEALRSDFQKIVTAMENWGEYVFNYFDYGYTNAFTESSNRKVKDVQRDTRWCSFDTTCARAIYGTYLRKQEKEARAREVALIRPPVKRRAPQPAEPEQHSTGKNRPGGGWRATTPVPFQMALDFTN
jgi:transposase